MENLGAMAYSRYTGFREITDRDVLELHCILKILPPKNENFQIKNSDIFHISDRNIAEAVITSSHNLWFWAEIRKLMYTPVNPSFTI